MLLHASRLASHQYKSYLSSNHHCITMQYLIPFLLTAQYAINDPNGFYPLESRFKFTKTWERTFENGSIGHGSKVTVLRCQNSSVKSIICAVENSQLRTYTEVPNGTTDPENPKFIQSTGENNELRQPFEIIFDQNGVKELVTVRESGKYLYGTWWEIANQFNVLWIKNLALDGRLIPTEEATIFGKCSAKIKTKKEKVKKDPLKLDGFKIDIEGGFDGMRLLYKKTRDTSSCEHGEKIMKDSGQLFLITSLEMTESRVIVSESEFSSSLEEQTALLIMGTNRTVNHQRFDLTLTEVRQIVDTISPVENPVTQNFTSQ